MYTMTEDIQIRNLQHEIDFLKQKLDEKAHEAETLKLTLTNNFKNDNSALK